MKNKTKPNEKITNIPQIEWRIKKCNRRIMKERGFKYYSLDDTYIYTFPIYLSKDKAAGCFICKLIAYGENNKVTVDLYKETIDNYYPQFYNLTNNGYADIIKQLNDIILYKFKEFDIYKKRKNYQRRTKNRCE